jgi:hypothetical protein
MGYAVVKVSAPLVVQCLQDGVRACEPLAPLPPDAYLEAVALERDVVTLTFSSRAWQEPLRAARVLDMVFRRMVPQ